jgi:hypothetical protein
MPITITITEAHVHKFLELCDAGLIKGLGTPEPGHMCASRQHGVTPSAYRTATIRGASLRRCGN